MTLQGGFPSARKPSFGAREGNEIYRAAPSRRKMKRPNRRGIDGWRIAKRGGNSMRASLERSFVQHLVESCSILRIRFLLCLNLRGSQTAVPICDDLGIERLSCGLSLCLTLDCLWSDTTAAIYTVNACSTIDLKRCGINEPSVVKTNGRSSQRP